MVSHSALNCRQLVSGAAAALVCLASVSPALAQQGPYFGIDDSEFADDGECDDLRFTGPGMSETLLTDTIGKDATDCRAAYGAGRVQLNPLFAVPASPSDIIYGDDTAVFANDGECDDIRFYHAGSKETIYLAENIGHDASDCRALMASGKGRWQANDKDIELGDPGSDWMAE